MVIAEPRRFWGIPWPDEQGCGRVLLFLVWRGNSGIFPRTSKAAFHGPSGKILGASELIDATALASFLGSCQFKYGGIAKAPGEHAGRFLKPLPCNCMTGKNRFRSISHVSLSRGDRYVSAAWICGNYMGHQAFRSSDQRRIIDCPMGEGSYTIEIFMNTTHREHCVTF